MTTKGKRDTVKSEYTVSNIKYYHLSNTPCTVILIVITGTKHTKTSLKANAD
jgi:hypothetical protein